MAEVTRRQALVASGAAAVAGAVPVRAAETRLLSAIDRDLRQYASFGTKASGGAGDTASGRWIEDELRAAGYIIERQPIDVPWFEPSRCDLVLGTNRAVVVPQAIVVPTLPDGVSGPLVRVDAIGGAAGVLAGAIALIDLPFARWSSIVAKPVKDMVTAPLAGGAIAVVIIPNGPTGGALALNAPGDVPLFAKPVAVLAPRDAAPFLLAARTGATATLTITSQGGRRPAFNLIARMDRGKQRWLAVSTPRSGWFGCVGERGTGVAAWLALARWAATAIPTHDLAFMCNSGHEYEYLGSARLLDHAAPAPKHTDFWLHLGANVAARDWHELGGALLPLPSADPQRFLVVSKDHLDAARRSFAGLPGLASPYSASAGAAGELRNILAAGYASVAGIFGAHRYHHSRDDDLRCVDPALVTPVVLACRALIRRILA